MWRGTRHELDEIKEQGSREAGYVIALVLSQFTSDKTGLDPVSYGRGLNGAGCTLSLYMYTNCTQDRVYTVNCNNSVM